MAIVGRVFNNLSQPVQIAGEKEHIRIRALNAQVLLGGPDVSPLGLSAFSLEPSDGIIEMVLERGDFLWAASGSMGQVRVLAQT